MTRACGLSVQKERGGQRTGRSRRASRYKTKTTSAVIQFRWRTVLTTNPTYVTYPAQRAEGAALSRPSFWCQPPTALF
jgi:hypothetical protein